jgi:hypothetical protein
MYLSLCMRDGLAAVQIFNAAGDGQGLVHDLSVCSCLHVFCGSGFDQTDVSELLTVRPGCIDFISDQPTSKGTNIFFFFASKGTNIYFMV